MRICFCSSANSGHIFPYLNFVSLVVKKGHTVDWYGVEDKSRNDLSSRIKATGASYTELPESMPEDLLLFFKYFKNQFGFLQAIRIMYLLLTDKPKFDMFAKSNGQWALNKFFMLGLFVTAANRALQMKKIQEQKNYDILLCDPISIPIIMSLAMDIPLIIMSPMIVDMDSSPVYDEMRAPALQDEYVCYLLEQKVKIAHPGWTYAKSLQHFQTSLDSRIILSSEDLFTASGKYPTHSDPKRTWYISNREFDIPFDQSRLRTIKEVQANPRIYVSFGTEMCNNYPLIDAFFEYFGNNDMDVLFTFGGNNVSYEMYKTRAWKNKNFKIEVMVNQREILASGKDIYFNHCGAGSIYEAIYYGVPMVCIPQEWDQPLNAATVAELGCGVIFPETHARGFVGKIQQSVETVLRDFDKIRQAALKQREKFMSGETTDSVIEQAFASFEKNPTSYKTNWEKFACGGPDPSLGYTSRMGLIGNYDVCLWFMLIMSVIIYVFSYVK